MKWFSGISHLLLSVAPLLQTATATQRVVCHDKHWQPDYVLVATAQNVTINCQSRFSTIFNGTAPGPPLYLKEGQTTWVRVYNNQANENVTVHWHGLSQRTAPFSDGTPLVSQWPIAPAHFFDYEIKPEAGDAGTYFYHSHVGYQAVSAHGMIIVESANHVEPYHYDADVPIVLGDFFARNDSSIEAGLVANPFVWSGESLAMTFNDRTGNASFANATDDSCKPYVLEVEPDKTYRLRFVNAAALSFITMGIEDHTNLTIIEADGQYTKPVSTDRLQGGSGQRFSALLKTKSAKELDASGKTSYWIRYENRERPTNISGYALLQYKYKSDSCPQGNSLPTSLPATSPVKLPSVIYDWLEYALEALNPGKHAFPKLSEVTRTVFIQVNQAYVNATTVNGSTSGILQWDENNLTWSEASLAAGNVNPYLVQVYKEGKVPDYNAAIANYGWDPKTRAYPALVGETLDIVWLSNSGPNGGFDVHPMHAHGAHFYDLGSGNGTYDAEENEKRFANYTPAKRDTTMLYRYEASAPKNYTAGWRAWRLQVTEDNVGAWMLHCHVLAHMLMGMQTVWVFGNASQIKAKVPEPYAAGYLDYGGSAYGNASYDPFVAHYYDK